MSEVICLWSCVDVIDRTQVRRGPPDASPQQTGTSRTVKRYPSSSGPITSNALPGGNGYANEQRNRHGHRTGQNNVHSFNAHRAAGDSQLHGQFNNALQPAGKDRGLNVSVTHGVMNSIKRLAVLTLRASLTFPLSPATSKQTQAHFRSIPRGLDT